MAERPRKALRRPVVFPSLGPSGYYVEVSVPGFQTTREDASVVMSITAEVQVLHAARAFVAAHTHGIAQTGQFCRSLKLPSLFCSISSISSFCNSRF
ncbi:MAG: hypothetical protein WBC04_20410, partial [Candidatus Acidiferrales bacterium]